MATKKEPAAKAKPPESWGDLLLTLPLTIREKIGGAAAKAIETGMPGNDGKGGTLILVQKNDVDLTDGERTIFLSEVRRWFLHRFRGKKYRGVMFHELGEADLLLLSIGARVLSIHTKWKLPTVAEGWKWEDQ